VVWWRAHVRARVEAAETVTQPIAWLNGITTVSMIAVAATVMSAASQLFPRSISLGTSVGRLFDISTATRSAANSLTTVSMMVLDSTVAVWGIVACLLLAPFAVYWMLAGDR
jgi:rRNA processing protein Krr1/Pno1